MEPAASNPAADGRSTPELLVITDEPTPGHNRERHSLVINHKKVKVTLVQALRLCTGRTAHRGSGGIALPFRDHGTRRG